MIFLPVEALSTQGIAPMNSWDPFAFPPTSGCEDTSAHSRGKRAGRARPASGTAAKPTKNRPTEAMQAKAPDLPNNTVITMISTDQLDDNNYNANELTPEQLEEYRAEVHRLGRLPKPVVVR